MCRSRPNMPTWPGCCGWINRLYGSVTADSSLWDEEPVVFTEDAEDGCT